MYKKFVIGFVFILLLFSFSGCADINPFKSDTDRFVGNWEKDSGFNRNLVFFSDGNCSIEHLPGIWEIKDGKLVIEVEGKYTPGIGVFEYYFSNNDNTLHIKEVDWDEYEIYNKK